MFCKSIARVNEMEEKTGLISIIVPVYNAELYLEKCIDSIIRQTYRNIEVIIVDDGSTDRSGKMCDLYEKKDERIRVIHKKNGGASSARNKGLEIARGEYIGFVDSDDYIAPDMYESLLKFLCDDVDIVTCGRNLIYPRSVSGLKRKILCVNKVIRCNRTQAIGELLKGVLFSYGVCEKIYRRELFDGIRFPLGKVSEDLPVTYALFRKCRNIVNIGEAKYYNFKRTDSMSRKEFFFRRMDNVLFRRDILLDVKENYPQFEAVAETGYISGVAARLTEIRSCKRRTQYIALEKRLIKVLKRMKIRILLNNYMNKSDKSAVLGLLKQKDEKRKKD